MIYPNYPNKHKEPAFISPEQNLEVFKQRADFPLRPPPTGVIICYQNYLWESLTAQTEQTSRSLYGMHTLAESGHQIGVVGGFGFGAPMACFIMEGLIAYGVRQFMSIGIAGSLQAEIPIGALVVCDRAIRDEGTSYHYAAPAKYALPSPALTARLIETVEARNLAYHVGTSWTIDTPYRETLAEIRHYRQEGVATVEMEASALFAVAQHRGVEIASIFVISDSLAGPKWQHRLGTEEINQGLQLIYEIALETLR